MTDEAEKTKGAEAPANDEFERRLAELQETLEEWDAADPNPSRMPGEPRRPGILATYLANHQTRH